MNVLVAQVCITICSGCQQTTGQLYMIGGGSFGWIALAAIAGTDWRVSKGEEPVGPWCGGIHSIYTAEQIFSIVAMFIVGCALPFLE